MARSETNKFALAYAIETAGSPGTLPGSPTWFQLEPNDVTDFAAKLKTVPRDPISSARQLGKGVVVDLDDTPAFTHDLVQDSLATMLESFVYAEAANFDVAFRGINIDSTGYVIPAATAAQAAKLQWVSTGPKSLMYSVGYANAANNGLKVLTADTASTDTAIAFSGAVAETAPTNAIAELAGVRGISGDLAITVSGSSGTLTSGNNSVSGGNRVDFTTLGLTLGQFIYISGFSAGSGYARVTSIAAQSLGFDKARGTLATDAGTSEVVDVYFGRFIRNVAVDADADGTRFLTRTFHLEGAFQDLDSVGTPEFEYHIGAQPNTLAVLLPLTDKASLEFGFVGKDVEGPTTTRKTNASSPILPLRSAGLSTTIHMASLSTSVTPAASTCFSDLKLTIDNGTKGEKCIGTLGNSAVNIGNCSVSLEATLLFTSDDIPLAIRANDTVTFDFVAKNGDGGMAIDLPSMTLEGGDREFPRNETIKVNLTGRAFRDTTLGTSIGVSLFPYLP